MEVDNDIFSLSKAGEEISTRNIVSLLWNAKQACMHAHVI